MAQLHVRTTAAATLLTLCLLADTRAASLLRSADIDVTVASPTSCEVTMTLTIDEASEIEHRIEAFDGSQVELLAIRGARQVGEIRSVGRTRVLLLRPSEPAYTFSYRARQPESRAHRCPVWLPTVPTDGLTRSVRLDIELPPAATPPGSSLPTFAWTGAHGLATLGHVPAFVRVPYAREGDAPGWDLARIMDVATMAMFLGGTAFWVWRRRR